MGHLHQKLGQEGFSSTVGIEFEPDFDFNSGEYRDLFLNASASAFQHPVWLTQFYKTMCASRGATSNIVVGRSSSNGQLMFVLPLIRRKMMGVALLENADLGVTDYAAPIVRKTDFDQLKGMQDLPDLVSKAIGSFDILRIKPIRAEARDQWGLFFEGEARALDFSAHATEIKAPFDAWRLETYGKSQVKYIDRRVRKLDRHGDVTIEIAQGAEIEEAITYLAAQRAGRFEGDPIQQDFVREFYAGVAKGGAENDYSRTYCLKCDGALAAVVFGICHEGRLNYLLIGCDYDGFGKFSPGLIMYDHIMKDWLNDGGQTFDFTIGDEPFKKDFGSEPTQMYELLVAKGPLGRLAKKVYQYKLS